MEVESLNRKMLAEIEFASSYPGMSTREIDEQDTDEQETDEQAEVRLRYELSRATKANSRDDMLRARKDLMAVLARRVEPAVIKKPKSVESKTCTSLQHDDNATTPPKYVVKEKPKNQRDGKKSIDTTGMESKPPERPPEESKNLIVCHDDEVEGEFMAKQVLGSNGKIFCGRKVVVLKRAPRQFGCSCPATAKVSEHTLCNGVVNQCDMSSDGVPTPYWTVLDAACELKSSFTSEQVVKLAVETMGKFGGWTDDAGRERAESACLFAWEVVKNHQNHPRKRDTGMGYIVDKLNGRTMSIRARSDNETFEYFDAMRARKAPKDKTSKLQKDHQPTETRPVVAVMGLPR